MSEKLSSSKRIKNDWPTGKLTQVGKIKPSDVDLWLSRYGFGSAFRKLHISCVQEVFDAAVRDRLITASPAAHLRSAKREKPIRLTPTFEQFKAIIADVRGEVFNADAEDSADFLEFLGLAGLGQATVAQEDANGRPRNYLILLLRIGGRIWMSICSGQMPNIPGWTWHARLSVCG